MRLTVLALIAAGALAACGQPAADKAPTTEPADAASPAAQTPAPTMPADAPPQEEMVPSTSGPPRSCLDELGPEASARLVERCRAVSPATRPPCNAANDCASIQGEIDRACALWERDGDPPAECAA